MVSLFKFSPLKCGLPVQGVVILAPWDHLFLYRTISLLLSSLYVFFPLFFICRCLLFSDGYIGLVDGLRDMRCIKALAWGFCLNSHHRWGNAKILIFLDSEMTMQDACLNREWEKWLFSWHRMPQESTTFINILCTDQIYAWSVQQHMYFMKYRITVQTSKTLACNWHQWQ